MGSCATAAPWWSYQPRGVVLDNLIRQAGALLVGIAIDTVPRGYRVARRARAVTAGGKPLDEDIRRPREVPEKAGVPRAGSVKVAGARTDHAGRQRSC